MFIKNIISILQKRGTGAQNSQNLSFSISLFDFIEIGEWKKIESPDLTGLDLLALSKSESPILTRLISKKYHQDSDKMYHQDSRKTRHQNSNKMHHRDSTRSVFGILLSILLINFYTFFY